MQPPESTRAPRLNPEEPELPPAAEQVDGGSVAPGRHGLQVERLLVDVHGAERLTSVPQRSIRSLVSRGLFPRPIHFGRSARWVVEGPNGLRSWCRVGCPPMTRWAVLREQGGAR